MGLEILKNAMQEGDGLAPIEADELLKEQISDETALKLVLQDASMAERYVSSKDLPTEWNQINEMYRAYVPAQKWPGSNQAMANLSMPVILEAIENILSQVHMAFFSDPQPFLMRAVGPTKPEAARAMSKVLCWALKQARTKEEIRKILKSILLYGQAVGKWGWQTCSHKKDTYSFAKDDSKKVTKHTEIHEVPQPTFEFIELPNILVDASLRCQDIRESEFVIHQMFANAECLEALADTPGYKNVPTREELLRAITPGGETTVDSLTSTKVESDRQYQAEKQTNPTSVNPENQPLEILEYWTCDRVITVLQRKFVVRNEENEFGRIPFVSCSFIDVLGSWYGFGVAKLLEGEQRFQAGVANAWVNGLSLSLNPMWHRKKGVGAVSQTISASPGRVINDDGELAPVAFPNNTAEALNALQASETRATRRVAANFGSDMPSQVMRTAEGVNAFSNGVQVRLQYFIENFADLVYVPVLEAFVQLCKDNIQPDQLGAILTEEDGKDFADSKLEIYNGAYALEILSSTKLAARRAMAALLPQLVNLFVADPVQQSLLAQGKKINYAELVQQAVDLTGWPADGLIIDATPEDVQRAAMMNPAVIAAQTKGQVEDQKHKNDMELEEEKATGRAGNQVVRHLLQTSGADAATPLANSLGGGPIATQPNE